MIQLHQEIVLELAKNKNYLDAQTFATGIRKIAGGFDIAPPKKHELLQAYHRLVKKGRLDRDIKLETMLKKREIRTLSGVAPIAVLTKPFFCPGRCSFCPTEVRMPKSYLSNEPAVMRAVLNKWDPYKQVQTRLKSLQENGHDTSKCEFIVIGGTWSFLPVRYQTWFIKRLYDGLNCSTSKSLIEAQKKNETAKNRAIGLCLETRPDYITHKEIERMRKLGCTRIEMGVQSTDDNVLKQNRRGHGIETVKRANKLLRDAGFKVSFHMMPNLPGSTPRKDIKSFETLFSDPGLKPDMLKIYPCVVVKNAEIYQWWKDGSYKPYSDKVLFKTLLEIKGTIPEYCRVTRLIRDIPTTSIYAGNMKANLRQDILQTLKNDGIPCKCIRCKEPRRDTASPKDAKLVVLEYDADDAKELFISYENNDNTTLYGFIRLRLSNLDNTNSKLQGLEGAAIVRELHVYGTVVPIDSNEGKVQHRGFGKKLMKEAERICKKNGYSRLAVISGIGVRKYYEKIGYHLNGTYMVKDF